MIKSFPSYFQLNVLNERGQYSATAGSQLEGLHVLTEGKDKVLNLIQEDVICTEDYTHSYPYDWRTKKPVILKASQQWFIDTARIKPKALVSTDDIIEARKVIVTSHCYILQQKKRPFLEATV